MPYAEATPRADISIPADHETQWLVIVREERRCLGRVRARGWFAARDQAAREFNLERHQFDLEEVRAR